MVGSINTALNVAKRVKREHVFLIFLFVVLFVIHFYFSNPLERSFLSYDDDNFIEPLANINSIQDYGAYALSSYTYAYPLRDAVWKLELILFDKIGVSSFWVVNLLFFCVCLIILNKILQQQSIQPTWRILFISVVALHPLNVELIQWASARRILLSLLFALWYIWYSNKNENLDLKKIISLFSIYVVSLLCYPCTVLLPLYTIWTHKRFLKNNKIAASVFLGTGVLALVIVALLSKDWVLIFTQDIIANANRTIIYLAMGLGRYAWNILFPTHLVVYYDVYSLFNFIGLVLLGAAIVLAYLKRIHIDKKYIFISLLLLIPSFGLVVAKSSFTAADRYIALALPFLFLALQKNIPRNKTSSIVLSCIVLSFIALTMLLVPVWETDSTLSQHCYETEGSARCLSIQIERHYIDNGCTNMQILLAQNNKKVDKLHSNMEHMAQAETPFYDALCQYQTNSINYSNKVWQHPATLPVVLFVSPSVQLLENTILNEEFSFASYTPKLVNVLRGQLVYLCATQQEYCEYGKHFDARVGGARPIQSAQNWGYSMQAQSVKINKT